ncbi:MAG: Bax inhibitor-1/YccA family protein [Nocardioides sp.]|uniref:Bax inhibitor-1/YccA family protein n=1 Tax=Nocardioides sp. TaxID=35761 RepID=UPI0039E28F29
MRSNNPVFNRSPEFNGQYTDTQTYAGSGSNYPGYGAPQQNPSDPSTWSVGTPQDQQAGPVERMTVDSVVQKSAITFGLVLVMAALTWAYIGDIATGTALGDQQNLAQLSTALLVGSGGAFVLSMVNSFKRAISPALVLVFAAFEGVALGALSKAFEVQFYDGIVMQAVLGTFAAFAGTLAAYKFFDIQVGNRFRTFTIAAMFGIVGLGLLELVLSLFGISTGLFGFGTLGLLMAVAGLVLGIFMLVLDFDFVEKGVAAGLPERESWRAAFALTVSLVWIYTNLLRILAILNRD